MFHFLEELQKNNSKEWMDQNRKWYQNLRDQFITWLNALDHSLAAIDDNYYPTPGRKGINRINNNLMFHPGKPVYKDHFGAGLDKAPNSGDFYIQIGLNECMLAGGLWRPAPKDLKSIREAIDYNGEELVEILENPKFIKVFGGLYPDEKLRRAPKGFPNDHPYLELLKNKTFAVACPVSRQQVLSPDFDHYVLEVYQLMLPFRRYLNQALSV